MLYQNTIRLQLYTVLLFITALKTIEAQWWDVSNGLPTCKAGTCRESDSTCECSLTIEHRLTMMDGSDAVETRGDGQLVRYNDRSNVIADISNIITADGWASRLVIAVNGLFPGPTIQAYENQQMIIHVKNLMHTDSTTIHWHGIHQRGSPYADGVAFISQCPILPGQTYTYRFTATPHGSSFYHAHIGDQRSMGLYGGLVIYPANKLLSQPQEGFVLLLQDWNHDDEPETLYQRMISNVFTFNSGNKQYTRVDTTQSIDGANFSRFQFHSGLINGKGRYYETNDTHNGAPLEIFEVEQYRTYRFRVISASTLYPFRVYIQDHPELTIVASDGYEISPMIVESFIIHPGERYDFTLNMTKQLNPGNYLLVAESIEVVTRDEYHAAEAIIRYTGAPENYPPQTTTNPCTSSNPCKTFNCPYKFYPTSENRICITFDEARSNEPNSKFTDVETVDETLFFNFAFPGTTGNTPGSVNGRQFIYPTSPLYTEPDLLETPCDVSRCGPDSICECTYSVTLVNNRVYQFVLMNLGVGRGWSHPVHLHGHYFFVMKMGYGSYNTRTGAFIQQTDEINCLGSSGYCNSATWQNTQWGNPVQIPNITLDNPPEKDTIIVPTGGYVVIRFKADNPGAWFFHCHIDLHNTNGMAMVLLESPDKYPGRPSSFATCRSHFDDGSIVSLKSMAVTINKIINISFTTIFAAIFTVLFEQMNHY